MLAPFELDSCVPSPAKYMEFESFVRGIAGLVNIPGMGNLVAPAGRTCHAPKKASARLAAWASCATLRAAPMPTGMSPTMGKMQKAKRPRAITVSVRLKAAEKRAEVFNS